MGIKIEENQSSQSLIEVHVKMWRIGIENKLINKAIHMKNKVKEESILWWALAKSLLAY